MVQVNKELLPYKLHFFLKHGGASYISFLVPVLSQRGLSTSDVGIVFALTPVMGALINMAVCSWADAAKLHKFLLIVSTAFLTVFMAGFFYLPKIPLNQAHLVFQCEEHQCCYLPCFDYLSVSNTFVEEFSSCNTSDICKESPVVSCAEYCIPSPRTIKTNHTEEIAYLESCLHGKYNLDDNRFITDTNIENITWMRISNTSFDIRQSCDGRNTSTISRTRKLFEYPEFWLNASFILLILMSFDISLTLTKTMCLSALGENRHRLGQTKLFGGLGSSIVAPFAGGLVNYFSKGKSETDYTSAVFVTSTLLLLSIVVATKMNADVPGKQPSGAMGRVLMSFNCISFLITSVVYGALMGLTWTFRFIYLKIVVLDWDPNFSDLSLLQGLLIWAYHFLGVIPFTFLSVYIIEKISHINTFKLTLAMSAIRLFLYGFTTNPWFFILSFALNGAAFGLYATTFAAYADYLAPKGAQATLQGIAVSFFIAGNSLGSLLGGILMGVIGGSKTFLLLGISVTCYTLLYMMAHYIHQRCYITDDHHGRGHPEDVHPWTNQTSSSKILVSLTYFSLLYWNICRISTFTVQKLKGRISKVAVFVILGYMVYLLFYTGPTFYHLTA